MRASEQDMALELGKALAPAVTLGLPTDGSVKMAQDSAALRMSSLMEHSLDMGMMPAGQAFMGYAALQDISQNGLVRACIETVADDMTRAFGQVKVGQKDDMQTIATMEAMLRTFKVQKLLHEAAEMTGYFGGCLVFIDTGVDDEKLKDPLDLSEVSGEVGMGRLRGFRVIDPINVSPGAYNSTNPLKDDFYRPRFWWVMGRQVHASRLIRMVANEVPQLYKPSYNFLGLPHAQVLWDYVMHFTQCREATAEMITKYSMTVIKTSMEEILFNGGSVQELDRRMQLLAKYRNNNTVIAVDKMDEDVVNVSTPMTGLTDIGRQALEFLASINRTPAVKLLGISPSGFNATGESDIRNYYDHVKSQREKLFGDAMRVITHCLQLHAFGRVDPEMTFEWNELGNDDEAAAANIQKTKADMVCAYLDRNVLSQEEARQFVANDPDSGLDYIDPDKLPENPETDGAPGQDLPTLQPKQDNHEQLPFQSAGFRQQKSGISYPEEPGV